MLIAIDAGHGHNTPGKRCPDDSMREHDFNTVVATKVCNILEINGIQTYRSDDETGNIDVPLITRTNNINSRNADLCVSIHANANTGTWNTANGIETYIIARGGKAEKLANIVQKKLVENTGRRDRGVKVSNLHMCRETKMPAILCECGFMDNREEAALLKSEEYRIKCAKSIAEGILEYLNITPILEKVANEIVEEIKQGSDEPVRRFKNGARSEIVYSDSKCTIKLGSLNPNEECDCFGVFKNRAMVRYEVGSTGNFKIGFVKNVSGVK